MNQNASVKTIGIVRKVDDLGRIVLPKEMRKILGIEERDALKIIASEDFIMVKKYESSCVICGLPNREVVPVKGKQFCAACMAQIFGSDIDTIQELYKGMWKTPEQVIAQVEADEELDPDAPANDIAFIHRVDDLGRVAIPSDFLLKLNIIERDPLEITVRGEYFILMKYYPTCFLCGNNEDDIRNIGNRHYCAPCLADMAKTDVETIRGHFANMGLSVDEVLQEADAMAAQVEKEKQLLKEVIANPKPANDSRLS